MRIPTLLVLVAMAGCDSDKCPKAEPPAAFAEIGDDLPTELQFCERKPELNESPTEAHIRWHLESDHDAWIKAVEHFESKGWVRVDQETGEFMTVKFVKEPYLLDFNVFNVLDDGPIPVLMPGWVHGHVNIQKAPCAETYGTQQGCMEDKLVKCEHAWPVETTDCAANKQHCATNGTKAACISDLCAVQKASSGEFVAGDCPAELVGG